MRDLNKLPVTLHLSVADVENLGCTDPTLRAYLDLTVAQALSREAAKFTAEVTRDLQTLTERPEGDVWYVQ